MNKIIFPIVNTITLLFTLFVNYWSNTGKLNGKTVGEVSARYDNLFTPASYAFSIWGFIYLFLIGFVVYQWYSWYTGKGSDVSKPGWWLAITNCLNSLWVVLWLYESTGWSVFVMLLILSSLLILIFKLDVALGNESKGHIAWVWWPLEWYFGWIVLATVANISAWLTKLSWQPLFSEMSWAILILLVSTAIYLFLIVKRNLRESALIGVWGIVAIAVRQWSANPILANVAVFASLIILLVIIVRAYRHWGKPIRI